MTCADCSGHYISRFFPDKPADGCLVVNGFRGAEIGERVREHVRRVPQPNAADTCPGFKKGPAIYRETS